MRENNSPEHSQITTLATDLDGTFIPLHDNKAHVNALQKIQSLRNKPLTLLYVTGRHLSSVQKGIKQYALPIPDGLICNVGTEFYDVRKGDFVSNQSYADTLQEIIGNMDKQTLLSILKKVSEIRLQEEEKQGAFKTSFYLDKNILTEKDEEISQLLQEHHAPYEVVSSIDPFTNDGLIDILPRQVNKAFALHWWAKQNEQHPSNMVFSGDSGNDFAALTGGFRGVLVNNSPENLQVKIRQQLGVHADTHFYYSQETATSGVLEGLEYFLNPAFTASCEGRSKR